MNKELLNKILPPFNGTIEEIFIAIQEAIKNYNYDWEDEE